MQIELLTTDLLIWLSVVLTLPALFVLRNNENVRSTWKTIAARPIAMASLVVLAVFFGIALLDSVHFRQVAHQGSDKVLGTWSLLDLTLPDLRQRVETTYSAPLAIYSFSKQAHTNDQGATIRSYPRLQGAGDHLSTAAGHGVDLLKLTIVGATKGLLLATLLLLAYLGGARAIRGESLFRAWKNLIRGETSVAWRTILLTATTLLLVGGSALELAAKYHLLGTDKVGQDVFYQALKSIRTGVLIGSLTLMIMTPIALVFGILAGYFGGWIDDAIQYVYTTISSIPGVLLIAAAILSLDVYLESRVTTGISGRADIRLLSLCVILGVTDWISLCRLLRGETLKLRELPYIQAAQSLGVSQTRLLSRHIVPNVLHIVMITVVLQFSSLVLAEAVLSYVGVGVDPSMISWGNMINSARLEMAREPVVWWSLGAALLFMFSLILSANLFADAVRDALDPRLRGT